MVTLSFLGACAQADQASVRFDIAAQPAASALNEFARQADVTLIFSYDSVSEARVEPLRGRYFVGDGLTRLLRSTRLSYRKSGDGTYLVCPEATCDSPTEKAAERSRAEPKERHWRKTSESPSS